MKKATFTQCSFLILFLLQTITHSDSKPKGMFSFQNRNSILWKYICGCTKPLLYFEEGKLQLRKPLDHLVWLAFLYYVLFPFVPENCSPEAWGEWQACSKSCGYGSQIRTRSIPSEIVNGEKRGCLGKTKDKRACNKHNCDGSSKYEFSTRFRRTMANIKFLDWN